MSNMEETGEQQTVQITLKHLQLDRTRVQITQCQAIAIRISYSNSRGLSDFGNTGRKFIFMIEETGQQTPPLSEGQNFHFTSKLVQNTTYSLICLNYPKLKCEIEVKKSASQKQDRCVTPPRKLSEKQVLSNSKLHLTEVLEQDKEEDGREFIDNSAFGESSHSKSDVADYQRMLSEQQEHHYDVLPNKYLKYFKQQFKLWRDFFETEECNSSQTNINPILPHFQPCRETPNPKSESHNNEQARSSIKSSDSASNCQYSAGGGSFQKQKSISSSKIHSQRELHDINEEEEFASRRIMKKTNSEYCLNILNLNEENQKSIPIASSRVKFKLKTDDKQVRYTRASSPRADSSQLDTFVDWAKKWAGQNQCKQVQTSIKGDRHLVMQWFSFLRNRFKIAQFMHT